MVAPTIQMPCSSTTRRVAAAWPVVRRVEGTRPSAAVGRGDDVVAIDADVDAVASEIARDRLPRRDRPDQAGAAFAPDARHGFPGGLLPDRPAQAFRIAGAVAGDGRATAGRLQPSACRQA